MSVNRSARQRESLQNKSLLQRILESDSKSAVSWLVSGGLICLTCSLALSQFKEPWVVVILASVLREIATILIVSGLWTGIYELFLRNSFIEIFQSQTSDYKEEIKHCFDSGISNQKNEIIRAVRDAIASEDKALLEFLQDQDKNFSKITQETNQRIESSAKIIKAEIRLAEQIENMGLVTVFSDAYDKPNFHQIISEAKKLTLSLNNGYSWLTGGKEEWFARRFSDATKETTFILLHPESPMIEVMAQKEDKSVSMIKDNIAYTIKTLIKLRQEHTTKLKVYGHKLFNPYSLYMTEEYALYCPFMAAGGKKVSLPMFQYVNRGKDCFYEKIIEDIERLTSSAESILEYDFDSRNQKK